MATKPATISLGISGRLGSKKNHNNQNSPATFATRPAHITQPPPTVAKRGHMRSASLENASAFNAKNTIGLPAVMGGAQQQDETQQQQAPIINQTGTLKSRNEQKRMRGQKFGSHSSLDQEALPSGGRTKFQNIRQIFEITKKRTFGVGGAGVTTKSSSTSGTTDKTTGDAVDGAGGDTQRLSSALLAASSTNSMMTTSMPSLQLHQQTHYQQLQHQQQHQLNMAYQQHPQLVRKPTPTLMGGNGSGNRSSYSEMSERLSITECLGSAGGGGAGMSAMDVKQKLRLQQQQQQMVQQQQLQLRQHLQAQRQHSQPQMGQLAHPHRQQQQHHHTQMEQQQQRNAASMSHLPHNSTATGQTTTACINEGETRQQPKPIAAIDTATTTTTTPTMSVMTSYENLLRPIAFKPIPFEPDYSIPNDNGRYVAGDVNVAATTVANVVGDRYGSTPSLAAVQSSNNMRFGSTSDLRHGSVGVGAGVATGGIAVGAYSSNNYCNSLMARRRGSRSLKINDSMESIRHTPDSDANSQSSTIKSTVSSNNNHTNNANVINNHGFGGANAGFGCIGSVGSTALGSGSSSINGFASGKYMLNEQCDMTPSPSDSGISDLETALKDRDSELSYLRQTMEHNEKDKESFWEQESKRLKAFFEAQQGEYLLKMKKMEQLLAMQQFQFKQHKIRHTEASNKLKEQVGDLKNENEILRSTNTSLKNSERNLKDSVAYIEEQLRESELTIAGIKSQLEESEWKVCERNGELALLKSQLKEANVEITLKEHAIVHLRHENTNVETQIFESLQENEKITKQQKQVEQQQARSDKQSEIELKQLNKIIILKDQVILALTNELAKLRKELSDLAIFQEYGEEPSGRFIRLKQQLDNLTDICNRTRRQTQKCDSTTTATPKEKVIDDANLELIINSLKIAQPLEDTDDGENARTAPVKLCAEKRLAKMSADIQNFVYGSQNLPDIAVNHNHNNNSNQHKALQPSASNSHKLQESTLDTLIEESASYAEEISKLRKQLDDVRVNFELEKRQWCEEREKVLNYQKQLQTHYINMYQKLRSLENSNEV